MRKGSTPVIARIQDSALLIDARTVLDREIRVLSGFIVGALA